MILFFITEPEESKFIENTMYFCFLGFFFFTEEKEFSLNILLIKNPITFYETSAKETIFKL